jgi:hypothetical protein
MSKTTESEERYIGYGKLLDLPSGRVGIELTINDLTHIMTEVTKMLDGKQKNIKMLVLPVKPENVKEYKTHSVKIGESKYK